MNHLWFTQKVSFHIKKSEENGARVLVEKLQEKNIRSSCNLLTI